MQSKRVLVGVVIGGLLTLVACGDDGGGGSNEFSDALADRMRTGVELIQQGHADTLIVSGGPGDGDVHETEAMRDFAVAAAAHFENEIRYGGRFARSPVTGGIDHEPI